MTSSYGPVRRALWLRSQPLIALVAVGCGAGVDSQVSPVVAPSVSDRDSVVARLERQRDDAAHRALDSQQAADRARGECQLVRHELDAIRERDGFEQTIWYRLGQAEITERDLRERASPGPRLRPFETRGSRPPMGCATRSSARCARFTPFQTHDGSDSRTTWRARLMISIASCEICGRCLRNECPIRNEPSCV